LFYTVCINNIFLSNYFVVFFLKPHCIESEDKHENKQCSFDLLCLNFYIFLDAMPVWALPFVVSS
jgi:hypothetical protein